jgi:hypothetical protein
MLLQPAPSIHTAFMRFSIDVVFMDGTLRVQKTVPGLRPWRVASARHAWGVLELAEGEIERRAIGLGDQLGVVEVTDELGAVEGKAAWSNGTWTSSSRPYGDADGHGAGPGRTSISATAAKPACGTDGEIRVLLVGTDRRFRSVAAALLTRRGCVVSLGERTPANIAELAQRERADVVVLDAGASLPDAAHDAVQIESLERPIGIVLVGDEAERGFSTMPVLPKWGSFDRIYGAIERARGAATEGNGNVRT